MIQSTLKCLLGTCAYFLLCSVLSAPELFAQPCTLISGNISLGGSAHDPGIQFSDPARTSASLSNGNFVIAWETRNGVDGDGNGAYFQVFNADGTTITTVIMPYSDINPSGIGDQGVAGQGDRAGRLQGHARRRGLIRGNRIQTRVSTFVILLCISKYLWIRKDTGHDRC